MPLQSSNIMIDSLRQPFDALSLGNKVAETQAISITQFAREIEKLQTKLESITASQDSEPEERVAAAKEILPNLLKLKATLSSQKNFHDITNEQGLRTLQEKYEATLLTLITQTNNIINSMPRQTAETPLSDPRKAQAMSSSARLITQKRKVLLAYRAIYNGRKYKKTDLKQDKANPIQKLSAENLKKLKQKLRLDLQQSIADGKLSKDKDNSFGIRPDEIDLFAALLNLPYKLQHATNYFSDIARSGSLNSLTEIQRNDPNVNSLFSTPGNLQELGNGGFVFFRCYVDGINGETTRYGQTRIITNLDLLRDIGWISLHDQLVPFPNKQRRQTLYRGKRIIFQATPGDVNNTAQAKKSSDGIQYTYRQSPMGNPNAGKKDLQKEFGSNIQTRTETISFTEEIFYGNDILPGIALSMIYRLRQLEACGFRAAILKEFTENSELENIHFLGSLIKDFYRIEGKYPAKLPIQYNPLAQTCFFQAYAHSDLGRHEEDRRVVVENPDGDGRLNLDLSCNSINSILAFYNEQLKITVNKISILQKRPDDPVAVTELTALKTQKTALEAKLQEANQDIRSFLDTITLAYQGEKDISWLHKRSYEYLQIVAEKLSNLIEEDDIDLLALQDIPLSRLTLMIAESWIALLENGMINWNQLTHLSNQELEDMADTNLSSAMDERGFDFSNLLTLYRASPAKFSWATCDDFDDLVLEHAHNIPDGMLTFIEEECGHEIDWGFVRDSLGETGQMLLDAALADYMGPGEDSEDDLEDDFRWMSLGR